MSVLLRRVLFSLLIFCAPIFAQVATGTYPYGSFDNKGFDTINRGNLNAHFSIPVINKPGRGLPFYYNLSYDSSLWYPATVSGVKTWTSVPNFGWRGDTEIANGYVSYTTGGGQVVISQGPGKPPLVCRNVIISNFIYHDPFGVQHPFAGVSVQGAPAACGDFSMPSTNGFTSLATDGSGYTMKVVGLLGASIITASGQTFAPPLASNRKSGTITDSNGNQISTDNQGHFTDTLGKQVLTVAGGSPNPETFTYTDTNGNPQTVQISYTSYTLQTNFGCSGIGEANTPNTYLVSAVTLPDGSAYHFQYEQTPGYPGSVTGRLASVTLPTGGTISYSYNGGNNGIVCTDGSAAGLTRSISSDSGSAASTWTYTRTIPSSNTSQTDIGDGYGNHSVYDFILAGTSAYYETNHVVYQGAAGGVVLGSVETCYNGAVPDCTASVPTLPISQIDTYREKNNGPQRGSTVKYNQYGLETEKDDWDYGTPSARGTALLRKEIWTYPTSGIVNLVSSDDVYDGAGNVVSATDYDYDQTTPTPTSAIPQHIAVTGPRGNLTTVSQWLKTGSSITTTNTYEDTGTLLSSTGPNGTTTYAYDPTASYLTGETLPTPSSGITLSSSATYDMNTGAPLTTTNLNGGVAGVVSYDALLRPTQTYKPNGEATYYYYSPNQTGVVEYTGDAGPLDTETLFDAYGRKSRVAVANGQATNPYYQTDYCYDAAGRLQFQSTTYQGTGWGTSKQCSGSGTTYSYDALNRITAIGNADGTNSYVYTDRAVSVTDVNGVQKITQSDALGRTTAICEISSNASMPSSGSPSSCGMDISGTGFLTTYSYDLANHKATVTQGVQQRVFQTDPLGRTILTSEPERGTTTYSYAYNSTGLVVTRKRPRANQINATVLTTTTTQYDSLGRVVSIGYDDGTPNRSYSYDTSAGWAEPQTNLKGLLSWATAAGSYAIFSYDSMGRVVMNAQCFPSECGNAAYDKQLTYSYDGAGNITNETDPLAGSIAYTRSSAGEITSVVNTTHSLAGGAGPATLLSNVQNGPFGPLTWTLGNGLTGIRTFDGLGRVNGGWVCNGSTQPTCSGGTQLYGFNAFWKGDHYLSGCDTILNQCIGYGYDEFDRLTSRTVTQGTAQNFQYVYDRWGNRWQQTATQGGGPQPTVTYNTSTNQIIQFSYDAAGNMTSDGIHSYTYDAEGNLLTVDNGSTAINTYDALNHRVRTQVSNGTFDAVFDAWGRITSGWDGQTAREAHIYWDAQQLAFRSYDGVTYFTHRNWVDTDRMHTDPSGASVSTYTSLPFGDGGYDTYANNPASWDFNTFGGLPLHGESNTYHAQFRQYSPTQGRWMSPDPYNGSMDPSNPQSFNRYSYVGNNPISMVDPTGLTPIQCAPVNGVATLCDTVTSTGNNNSSNNTDWFGGYDASEGDFSTPLSDGYSKLPDEPTRFGDHSPGRPAGGGYSAPRNGSRTNKILQCASKLANQLSIAGVLGITGEGGGVGSTIGTAFLGNTFSGIVDTGTHIYNNAKYGGNGNQVVGDLVLGGARQGIPGGGPFSAGVVGLATGAGVDAAAEGMAGPVGWAKLGIDGAIFAGTVAYCTNHP